MRHLASSLALTFACFGCCVQAQQPSGRTYDLHAKEPVNAPADWRLINDALFERPVEDFKSAAIRLYVWGMPLMHGAMIRDKFVKGDSNRSGSSLNRFVHHRLLAGPDTRIGVGINNDTIYSLAWVDLKDGPLILTTPDFGDRYYTFSMNFADTSANLSLGRRTHGGQLPPVFIHGPNYRGQMPQGLLIVPSETRYLLIAGRVLVRSPDEYPAVHALQDQIGLVRWEDWNAGMRVAASPPSAPLAAFPDPDAPEFLRFLIRLNSIVQDWSFQPKDKPVLDALAFLEMGPGTRFDPVRLSPEARRDIESGINEARNLVSARALQLGIQRNGWTINYSGPRFGNDYLLRAGVAKDQPNVAIPEEALYPLARVDASGKPLNGRYTYQVRFKPGLLPPVNAFWSITAYDDNGRMMANQANRYSVGDRTAGLCKDPDGGLTITISARPPKAGPSTNWLPVSRDAPFYLMLRLYQPREEILRQIWLPPAVNRIN